jgi:hypothetical protein
VAAQCKRFIGQQFGAPAAPPLAFDVTVQVVVEHVSKLRS